MTQKKISYKPKTRNDISNPFYKLSHNSLLKLGCVEVFNGKFEIQKLSNGRIKVEKHNENKILDDHTKMV